jgi:DNA invertase Pin-like site-specific DNA recombinase
VNLTLEQAASAVESFPCPACGSPAGRPCRTGSGDTAFRYHTSRFILVPELSSEPEVLVPRDRGPGHPWQPGPAVTPTRIGYAFSTPVSPGLQNQLDVLRAAGCEHVFQEEASVRVKARPELTKALRLAVTIRNSGAGQPVILTVHELRRLARDAAELMALSAMLCADGVRLELLTGSLAGIHDPDSMLFTVLAAAAELDRSHRREKTVEGQQDAAAQGRPGGRPRIFDEEMLAAARAMREQGASVPEIAGTLVIKAGRNAGKHPSLASVYRALAEADAEVVALISR